MVAGSELDDVVNAHMGVLRASFRQGKTKPQAWRRQQLLGLQRLLEEGRDELCEAMLADLGKAPVEGWFQELNTTLHEVQHQLDHLGEYMTPQRVGTDPLNTPGWSSVQCDPLGVVAIFGAWNYPVCLALLPLAGALAAGNCVMLKTPSDKYSAATSAALGRLVPRYLDQECVRVVEGDRHATQAVLTQRFDLIFFTGGSTVGRMVAEAAAKHLTPCVLELGGKSPAIVDRSADLRVAARRLTWASFMNAGQTCVRPDHFFVHADVADRFLDEMRSAMRDFYGPDPQQTEFFGRVINERAHRRLTGLLDSARERVVAGGETDAATRFMAPTLMDFGEDVQAFGAAPVMQEEIFGPIVPICRYRDLDAVVDFVNAREKPLALYLFTTSGSVLRKVQTETTSGGFVRNDAIVHLVNDQLPFGGVGNSGMGAYHGRYSFETFSHKKAVLLKTNYLDVAARYPPYVGFNVTLLEMIQKPRPAWQLRAFKYFMMLVAVLIVRSRMPSRQDLKFKVMAWAAKYLM